MAFYYDTGSPDFPKIYNVEKAVGPIAPNAQGDVKLVQYMIRHLYGNAAAALKVDGWIGPTTNTWIKRFQTDAKNAGNNVLVDGKIDRAFGQLASVSKTVYAMLVMNTALRKANPTAYANLPNAVPISTYAQANPYNDFKPVPNKVTTVVTGEIWVLLGQTGTPINPLWSWAVYDGKTHKFKRQVFVPGGTWLG